jgi:hypothetical protein
MTISDNIPNSVIHPGNAVGRRERNDAVSLTEIDPMIAPHCTALAAG